MIVLNDMKKWILFIILAIVAANTVAAAISRGQIDQAITNAERDVVEMQAAGLSTTFVNNTLNAAKMLLEGRLGNESFDDLATLCRAYSKESVKRYCLSQLEILTRYASRETNVSPEIVEENYPKIIELTGKISETKRQAFEARDRIRAVELKLKDYETFDIDTTATVFALTDAKEAMREERYDDAFELVTRADAELEAKRTEITLSRTLLLAGKNFFARNIDVLIQILIVVFIVAAIAQHPARIYLLKKKIARLNAGEKAIHMLIKDAQKQRFASGKISESMYDIKMGVYRKKLDEVREQLPLAERSLKALQQLKTLKRLSAGLKDKIINLRKYLPKSILRFEKKKQVQDVEKGIKSFVFVQGKPLQPYKPKKDVEGIEKIKESVKGFVFAGGGKKR